MRERVSEKESERVSEKESERESEREREIKGENILALAFALGLFCVIAVS